MIFSYRYSSLTQDCEILRDGVVIEHQPLTQTARRISELRANVADVTVVEQQPKGKRSTRIKEAW